MSSYHHSTITRFRISREIKDPVKPSTSGMIIDNRLESLEISRRNIVPFTMTSSAPTTAIQFDSSENRFLLCGTSRGNIFVVDFGDANINHKIIPSRNKHHHEHFVSCVQWYPVDSNLFATSGRDKILKIWDSNSMEAVEHFKFSAPITQFHWTVGQNKKQSSLISVAIGTSNVSLVDPRLGAAIHQIRCVKDGINSVRWLSSANFVLATGSQQGCISLWDARSSRTHLAQIDLASINGATTKKIFNEIVNICDDDQLLVAMSRDGILSVFDAISLKELVSTKFNKPGARFSMTSEGSSLSCFVPTGNIISVSQIDIHGRRKNHEKRTQNLQGHFQPIASCVYRSGHQQLVTAGKDRLILVWAPKTDEVSPESEHQESLHHLHEDAFSDDE